MKRTAIYPGTFDPITNGHVDLIKRGLRMFDEIIVAVARIPRKSPLFALEKRVMMVKEAVKELGKVKVEPFDGLLIDYAKSKGVGAIIRGLRAVSDFEYELQMALMNRKLDSSIETVFMMPSEEYSYLTSSIIKEIASLNGSTKGLVPEIVKKELKKKFKKS